ncbi:acetyl-CoA carboxylase biotin carboxyl carrier protein [Peptacetobacter hominis]|uniref:Biotin carboxyl carrier protein of acetyl-CoA carboxylase n=1 Tax=Peptacetobacter hominis TaxID=2743610 RepID=A0A544QVP2_9FIRM|nr:acetyl-CoA carboxylase biotin carboxyl carrier protein [Peptacetobacter hominis]TQQ84763.1 acetyl-CoA carboxylase biotin carboxyl carrier protein [Peptacetobacter hominis]
MNFSEIKDLLRVIDSTDLKYVKIENNEMKIEVSKEGMISSVSDNNKSSKVENNEYIEKESEYIPSAEKEIDVYENDDNIFTVLSPLMGTFYTSPGPDAQPFVKIGDHVKTGDSLCILEAMKLMNEIKSDVDGEIIDILVENESLVEYNRPLFKIRTSK